MTTTKMLISAQRAQQLRVAIVEGTNLKDYQVDITDHRLTRGNIYRGIVANIQPSLNAAFIDIGEERHAFLPVGDILPSAYHHKVAQDTKRPRIDQVLQRGRPILVQVTKDGVGQKGAALTTNISIAGRYLVLTPFDGVRGISRKADDDDARKKIRGRLKKLTLPEGHGVIVRTNGLGQNQTTLNRDLNALLRMWKKVKAEIGKSNGPQLLYSDQDLVVQAMRDYLDSSIEEVLVDNAKIHEQVETYMRAFMPRSKTQLKHYDERLPLFSRYRLETQIDRITDRTVPLPGGGYLVIDPTEALTAIDVNSGRATRNADHDESIFQVNVEAAKEVARQLRLRDIGGLVVVDFIDMRLRKHKSKLEKTMRDAMKEDKARYSVGRLSSNGLLEINRQRIKQALRLRTHRPCPSCQGVGTIASPEFAALSLLGRLESRVATGLVDRVTIALHPEVADAFQNHHRSRIAQLEEDHDMVIEVLSASNLDRVDERIEVHQREADHSAPESKKSVLSATDLTLPKEQIRKRGASAEDAEDEEGESTGRTRKRRRRRRSSRGRSKDTAQANHETKEGTQEGAQETAQGDGAEDAEGSERKTRTRRSRGGRRRGRSSTRSESQEAQDSAEEPKKKSTSRTRKAKKDTADSKAEAKAESKTDEAQGTGDEDKPKRGRRRVVASSSGRRKVASSKSSAASSESSTKKAPKTTKASKATKATKSSASPSDAEATEESTSKPRRRRVSRGRISKAATEAETEAPKSTAAEADGEKKSKPRTRRRKSVSDEGAADTAEVKAEKPARKSRARTKKADSDSSNGRADSKAETSASPAPAKSEAASDNGTTKAPAKSGGIRWQWWGGGSSESGKDAES